MKRMVFLAGMASVLFLFALNSAAQDKPVVFVTILPQHFFMERLAGDLVDTRVLVSSGANPHVYEPTPSQMSALSKAKAFFSIGIEIEEAWLPRISSLNASLRIFPTHQDVHKISMVAHEHHEHEGEEAEHHEAGKHEEEAGHEMHHGDKAHEGHGHHEAEAHESHEEHGHGHHHVGLDPHIWLDPLRVRTIVNNMYNGLIEIDPEHKAIYDKNLAALLEDIDKTDKAVAAIVEGIPSDRRTFLVFHPSWGYFAERYGLTQLAIESEGKEPSLKELTEIVEHAREKEIGAIFVQPQTSQRSARVIAQELGAEVVVADPLAKEWDVNLLSVAKAFAGG